MRPYFEDTKAGITIYHGDCREILPGLAADATVTDPPYGTGYYATDRVVLTADLLLALPRPCAVFGWPERLVRICVEAKVVPDEWITWWPTNGACRGFNPNGLWRESEHIAVFGRAAWRVLRRSRSGAAARIAAGNYQHRIGSTAESRGGDLSNADDAVRLGDVWRDAAPALGFQSRNRLHPNEKPRSVCMKLVEALTTPGALVLDPFSGSGTTLLAAALLRRRAIGVEIEERYCEIAARRLDQQVLELGA